MATYLVTGGCGFIGSHLADDLVADGHSVRILDDLSSGRRTNAPAGAEVIVGSICDPAVVGRALEGVDACFHMAAIASVIRAIEDWPGSHAVNLGGTINLFDAVRRRGGGPVPVVYASSAAVYGDGGAEPKREDGPARPVSPYGADKLACETHARAGGRVHGLTTAGLRFFNIYGPRQDPASPYSGVISIFLDRALAHRPLVIHGDGRQTRDFVHVADAVRAARAALAAASAEGPIVNICTGRGTTIRDLARTVAALADRPPPIEQAPARAGDIHCSLGDPGEAHRRLGWRADVGLAEGLRRTLEAMRVSACRG